MLQEQKLKCLACGATWVQYNSIVTVSADGDTRVENNRHGCLKCEKKPGKKAIMVEAMKQVTNVDGCLVVFGEYEIKGVPDFRDRTAIYRRR